MKENNFLGVILDTVEGFCIVKIVYSQNETEKTTNLLIDTGSSSSLISDRIIRRKSQLISFRFCCNESTFIHEFTYIDSNKIPDLKDYPISGILGTDFFLRHKLVLDFGINKIFYNNEKHLAKKRSFFYPLRLNKTFINVPIIGIKMESDTYACLVDSGSNHNVISSEIIVKPHIQDTSDDANIYIESLDENILGKSSKAKLYVATLMDGKISYIPFYIDITITNTSNFSHNLFKSRILKGVLGYAFLHEYQWVIDFSRGMLYSKF